MLINSITLEELHNAIFHMKDDSSPGPDGFSANFFKSSLE